MSTRSLTKLVIPCTVGSHKIRSGFKITSTRFFWRKLHRRSTRNCSPITCSKRRAIPRCAPTSSTGKSTICGARFSGRPCLLSLRKQSTPLKKAATRSRLTSSDRNIAGFSKVILLKTLYWMPSWIWNACVFRISTTRSMSTSMRQAFLLRRRFRNACLPVSRGVWKRTLVFFVPAARSFHWKH